MTDQPEQSLVRREANPLAVAETTWTPEQRAVVANFCGVHPEDPALLPFLAVATSLDLNPMTGEIWLIKGRRKNPDTGEWEDFYRPAVGRDGFLKKARESPKYQTIRSGVVCANDTFEWEDTGDDVRLLHRAASLPKGETDVKKIAKYRGAVIGAWAKVFFSDGSPPFFTFMPITEHGKVKDGGSGGWEGAWSYTSKMMEKCAQSYALRIAFGVSGAVPVDELRDGEMSALETGGPASEQSPLDASPHEGNEEFIDSLDISDDLKQTMKEALREANELSPFSWSPSKTKMILANADEGKAEGVLANVEHEISTVRRAQEEAERAADEEEEGVQDAVQVVAVEELEEGMVIELDPLPDECENPCRVGGVVARDGSYIVFGKAKGKRKDIELAELPSGAEVPVLSRPERQEDDQT